MMKKQALTEVLEQISSGDRQPDEIFAALLPALGEALECDRCFLYLRSPDTRMGKVPYCWRRSPDFPEVLDADWKKEPESLPDKDPLFAAALRTDPSIFVEDVETASPDVLNKEFEHENFGHRALIHAHLCQNDRLWGVLQPCLFGRPRVWTESERSLIATVTENIAPLAVAYVQSAQV